MAILKPEQMEKISEITRGFRRAFDVTKGNDKIKLSMTRDEMWEITLALEQLIEIAKNAVEVNKPDEHYTIYEKHHAPDPVPELDQVNYDYPTEEQKRILSEWLADITKDQPKSQARYDMLDSSGYYEANIPEHPACEVQPTKPWPRC